MSSRKRKVQAKRQRRRERQVVLIELERKQKEVAEDKKKVAELKRKQKESDERLDIIRKKLEKEIRHQKFLKVLCGCIDHCENILQSSNSAMCTHGLSTLPHSAGCYRLMAACFEIMLEEVCAPKAVQDAHEICMTKFPKEWGDARCRESIRGMAVSFGTRLLQTDPDELKLTDEDMLHICTYFAMLALMAENYDSDNHHFSCLQLSIGRRFGHICEGRHRAVVKFFLQRTHCSCLENIYSDVKSHQSKLGCCHFCKNPTKVRNIWVCTRCNYADYCSKECQIAHWSVHKKTCDYMKRNNFHLVILNKPTKSPMNV